MRDRIEAGLEHWSALAALAMLPADGWQPHLLASRQDAKGDRTVILLRHRVHPPVICKQAFRVAEAEGMAKGIAAQDRAARALAGHPVAGVPQVLAVLPDRAAALMQAVEGATLMEYLGTAGQATALRRAGEWLDAFHRSGPIEARTFQPRFIAGHLARVAVDVRAGTRKVPRKHRFLSHVAALLARVDAARGAATVSAVRHGDLTARNLIVAPDRVWGIDLSDAGQGPVGYDIARLLVYLAEQTADVPTADVVPADMMAAFFDGYRLTGAQDDAVRFLILSRLLSDWLSMPESHGEMTVMQVARFERINQLADAAFA